MLVRVAACLLTFQERLDAVLVAGAFHEVLAQRDELFFIVCRSILWRRGAEY